MLSEAPCVCGSYGTSQFTLTISHQSGARCPAATTLESSRQSLNVNVRKYGGQRSTFKYHQNAISNIRLWGTLGEMKHYLQNVIAREKQRHENQYNEIEDIPIKGNKWAVLCS